MSDLGSELIKRYGSVVIIAAVVVAPIVWALAHFASAPGSPVKVLWGLVEYTKSPAGASEPKVEPPTPIVSVPEKPTMAPDDLPTGRPEPVSGSLTLEVTHGLSVDGYPEFLAEHRSRLGLRELRALESGRPISETPPGTFFFVAGHNLWTRSSEGGAVLLKCRASRFQSDSLGYFEVHHRSNGELLLLVYSAESDADRIRSVNGTHTTTITVAPRPWASFSSLVHLPFDRIISSESRDLEIKQDRDMTVLELSLR